MNAFVIFDVSSADITTIRAGMNKLGYRDSWSSDEILYHLPHNSCWKPNCELQRAKKDLEAVIRNLNNDQDKQISLLRCIVLSGNPWEGIAGVPATASL